MPQRMKRRRHRKKRRRQPGQGRTCSLRDRIRSENGLPPIARLRAQIEGEEFDYLALLRSLQDYAYPRDKITTMLRRGDIVRVKKGIYVFGDAHARRPYSREILANMIYGPSYVSLDSALQY